MPAVKEDSEEKKVIKRSRVHDQGRSFIATKVRAIVDCDSCGAKRVIFLIKL